MQRIRAATALFRCLAVCTFAAALYGQASVGSAPPPAPVCPFPFQAPELSWDATAQLLAGIGAGDYKDSFEPEQKDAWTLYSRRVNADWKRLKTQYLDRIDAWRGKALGSFPARNVGFYPFSGPDAANLLTFFPDEREYVMIGLERVGCVPASVTNYTPAYFSELRQSVQSIVALGFFRTEEMQRDYSRENEGGVQGVLPALLMFLARSGFSVADVTPLGINRQGEVIANLEQPKRETRGVAIQFKDAQHGVRTLRYFSLNLQNASLERKPGSLHYLQGLASADTLVKSASYLMHKRYFSTVRSAILTQSRVVVEDDSGIPYHWFDAGSWDVRLFGTYSKPIALFKNSGQDDLRDAFASRTDVQPLDFGIGYRWRVNESNLILAMRRAAPGSR